MQLKYLNFVTDLENSSITYSFWDSERLFVFSLEHLELIFQQIMVTIISLKIIFNYTSTFNTSSKSDY